MQFITWLLSLNPIPILTVFPEVTYCLMPYFPWHHLLFSSNISDFLTSFFFWVNYPSIFPKKGSAKECSNYCTIALISYTSKVMLKILQARLQQYMNRELPDVQTGFRKGKETRDQIANILWIIKKEESSRKTSTSALLTTPKPLSVWITTNYGKFLKSWECQTTWPTS